MEISEGYGLIVPRIGELASAKLTLLLHLIINRAL